MAYVFLTLAVAITVGILALTAYILFVLGRKAIKKWRTK